MSNWISKHLGIRLDRHTLGNLVKNVSPAAAVLAGGPLGVALAGGLGAVGERMRGKTDLGSLLKAGVSNAAIGAGANAGIGALKGAASGVEGAGGAGGIAAPTAPAAVAPTSIGGISMPGATASALPSDDALLSALGTHAAPVASAAHAAPGLASRALGFAESHPNAMSGLLQGVGSIAGAGSENRLRNAEASAAETANAQTSDQLAQREKNRAALAPYWQSLAAAPPPRPIAANPYLPHG